MPVTSPLDAKQSNTERALHALVLLDLLRLLERPMRRRHLHLRAVEQMRDGEYLYSRVFLAPARRFVEIGSMGFRVHRPGGRL